MNREGVQLSQNIAERMPTMKTTDKRESVKKQQQEAYLQEKNDWEWVTSDERGLRVVRRVMEVCGVFRAGFNPNALTMAFGEGQRNVGLYLWDRLGRFVPEQIPELLKTRDSNA